MKDDEILVLIQHRLEQAEESLKDAKVPHKHSGAISLFDTEFVLKDLFSKELSKDLHDIFNLRVEAVRKHLMPENNKKGS